MLEAIKKSPMKRCNGLASHPLEKDQLKRIFDEFYRADKLIKFKDSAGLGLSICKRIVEKLGGRIWADSEGIGKGSIFYFTLKTDNEK